MKVATATAMSTSEPEKTVTLKKLELGNEDDKQGSRGSESVLSDGKESEAATGSKPQDNEMSGGPKPHNLKDEPKELVTGLEHAVLDNEEKEITKSSKPLALSKKKNEAGGNFKPLAVEKQTGSNCSGKLAGDLKERDDETEDNFGETRLFHITDSEAKCILSAPDKFRLWQTGDRTETKEQKMQAWKMIVAVGTDKSGAVTSTAAKYVGPREERTPGLHPDAYKLLMAVPRLTVLEVMYNRLKPEKGVEWVEPSQFYFGSLEKLIDRRSWPPKFIDEFMTDLEGRMPHLKHFWCRLMLSTSYHFESMARVIKSGWKCTGMESVNYETTFSL